MGGVPLDWGGCCWDCGRGRGRGGLSAGEVDLPVGGASEGVDSCTGGEGQGGYWGGVRVDFVEGGCREVGAVQHDERRVPVRGTLVSAASQCNYCHDI